jgi:hypothetical protein
MNLTFSRRQIIVFILSGSVFFTAIFLATSFLRSGAGFPLDDAWIHQTYARNLGMELKWFYFPGNTTNGSTAPLWTLLLSLGYFLRIPYLVWSYGLGMAFLTGLGLVCYELGRTFFAKNSRKPLLLAVLMVGEWHMIWAAGSGMETIALACIVVLVFLLLAQPSIRWWLVGWVCGLSIWLRPDAISLMGPAGLVLVMLPGNLREKTVKTIKLIGGLALPLAGYLIFNQVFSGSWLPNTFYAKQNEYAALLAQPLVIRFAQLALQPLVGVGILLLPGWLYQLWYSIKNRQWVLLGLSLWWLGYTMIYATLLPVTYQHGRYEIPAMPVFLIGAFWGTSEMLLKIWNKRRWRIFGKAWSVSIFLVWVLFIGLGAGAYADDVTIIQSEMVKTAQWISENTPENTLVAAHDIGALGYWGNRKIIDLAGLVTPGVIPFIRNEPQLAIYLDEQKADILMTFPKWYVSLTHGKEIIYQSDDFFTRTQVDENMTVYSWRIK